MAGSAGVIAVICGFDCSGTGNVKIRDLTLKG